MLLSAWYRRLGELSSVLKRWGYRKFLLVFAAVIIQSITQFCAVVAISPLMDVIFKGDGYSENKIVSYLSGLFAGTLSVQQVLALVFIAQLFALGSNLITEYIKYKTYDSFMFWLRSSLVRSLSSRPYFFFLKENPAALQKELTGDANLFCNTIFWTFLDTCSKLVVAISLVVACFSLSPQIAVVFVFVGAGFYVFMTIVLKKKRRTINLSLHSGNESINKILLHILYGIKSIMINGSREFYLNQYNHDLKKVTKNNALTPVISNAPKYLMEFLALSLMITYFSFVLRQQANVDIASIGGIAFAGYRMLPLFQTIYSNYSFAHSSIYAMDSVKKHLLDLEVSREESSRNYCAEDPTNGAFSESIQTRNLAFSYDKNPESVIRWQDLEIKKGDIVGICGPSGCGKSTLLDLLLGLNSPSNGEILIDGVILQKTNAVSWQKQIGYVGQDLFLVDGTIKENILFGRKIERDTDEAVIVAAKKAEIHHFIEGLPDGYETLSGDRGLRLSGGQRQRIVIARALLKCPQILILDEATSALDEEAEKKIIDTLCGWSGGMTIIMVTHRLSTLSQTDRIIELE